MIIGPISISISVDMVHFDAFVNILLNRTTVFNIINVESLVEDSYFARHLATYPKSRSLIKPYARQSSLGVSYVIYEDNCRHFSRYFVQKHFIKSSS